MNIPPHLEPLRRSKLMEQCRSCDDVTDLQSAIAGITMWLCWKCQGLKELTLHKQCEGCNAWFVGTLKTKRCGHGAQCKEATG